MLPIRRNNKVLTSFGNLDTLCHTLQVTLRVFQSHDVGMVGKTADDLHGNTHVGRGEDVIEHQRSLDTAGKGAVVVLHLLFRQGIVGKVATMTSAPAWVYASACASCSAKQLPVSPA